MGKAKEKRSTDRRVERTHELLLDALIALILERGWDEITVQDVCDRANVGRSTFYMHFANKEKLLLSGFDALHRTLRAQVGASEARDRTFGFVRGLVEHVHESQRLFRAVVGKRSGLAVQRRFRQLLIQLTGEDLAVAGIVPKRREAATHFLAGALFELLTWWVDTRTPLAPREMEVLFLDLTKPVLASLRGAA